VVWKNEIKKEIKIERKKPFLVSVSVLGSNSI
jgi:hypothetical protein